MKVRIDQYYNEIFMSGYAGARLIDIRFNGAFTGDLIPEGHVSMNRNRILISNIKEHTPSDIFMRYAGSLDITKVYVRFKDSSVAVPVIKHSDEVNRIFGKWSEAETKYEDYNKSFKYLIGGSSLLSYVNKDERFYIKGKNRNNFISSLSEDGKILNNLIAKRSE